MRTSIANILTGSRFFLSPLFAAAYGLSLLGGRWAAGGLVAMWVLFVVIELTDLLDGYIARRTNTISDTGKVLDPYADVFARLTYFACMLHAGIMPLWFLLIVIYRELGIILIRMLLLRSGVALGAKLLGKLKSTFYGVTAFTAVFEYGVGVRGIDARFAAYSEHIQIVALSIYAMTAALSLASLLQYFVIFLRNLRRGGE
jgi:CDP-diacylglycerol--glycerol-3-phosphate 3-phosphatidyltransferase